MMSLYTFLTWEIKLLQTHNKAIPIAVRCKARWIDERSPVGPSADRVVSNPGETQFVSCRIMLLNGPIILVEIARRSPDAQRRERIMWRDSGYHE